MKKVCVLGLGYIGLPTAAMFAAHGFRVVGVDVNHHVVDVLNNGDVPIQEPGLEALVRTALGSGNLRVSCRPEPSDAFVIAVPTPLTAVADRPLPPSRQPVLGTIPHADLSFVQSAAQSIVEYLRPGNLVVLESTVPPRTTAALLLPILQRSGLSIGEDGRKRAAGQPDGSGREQGVLFVAHCPERVLPGRILEELVRNDRIIGGIDRASAELAKRLYASFVEGNIFLTDATTAEMTKLMENTYRDVNIALANEFSLVADQVGIDVWEAIDLANHHPRVNILKPGPGVGGHCIAVDPWFIAGAAPDATPLIQTARRVNDAMPARVVQMVKRAMAGIARPVIACLGLAYKANVGDTRESPALQVVDQLIAGGFVVRAYDPHVPQLPGLERVLVPSLEQAIAGSDGVVVLADHDLFRHLSADDLRGGVARWVLDTRHCLRVAGPGDRRARPVVSPGAAAWPATETVPLGQGAH